MINTLKFWAAIMVLMLWFKLMELMQLSVKSVALHVKVLVAAQERQLLDHSLVVL